MPHLMLEDLQDQQKEWADRNFKNKKNPLAQVVGVNEEFEELGNALINKVLYDMHMAQLKTGALGKLSHGALKMLQGIRGTAEEHRAEIADAVGDIVIYLAGVCNDQGLRLSDCVEAAWDEVERRNWVDAPKDGRTE